MDRRTNALVVIVALGTLVPWPTPAAAQSLAPRPEGSALGPGPFQQPTTVSERADSHPIPGTPVRWAAQVPVQPHSTSAGPVQPAVYDGVGRASAEAGPIGSTGAPPAPPTVVEESGGWLRGVERSGEPRISLEAGFTTLKRTGSGDRLMVINEDTLAPVFSSSGLGFDFEPGVVFSLGVRLGEASKLELTYFGLNEWSDSTTLVGDNDLSLPGDIALASFDFFAADSMDIRYASDFNNAELNYHGRLGPVKLLAGARYLGLHDELSIRATDSDTGTSDYRISADNHLVGGQVGVGVDPRFGRFGLLILGKIGAAGNFSDQNTFIGDFDNTDVLRDVKAQNNSGSFLAEAIFGGSFFVTDSIVVRAGYRVLWLESLTLAPEQLDFTDTAASSTTVDSDGDAYVHGANASLELRWGGPRR